MTNLPHNHGATTNRPDVDRDSMIATGYSLIEVPRSRACGQDCSAGHLPGTGCIVSRSLADPKDTPRPDLARFAEIDDKVKKMPLTRAKSDEIRP